MRYAIILWALVGCQPVDPNACSDLAKVIAYDDLDGDGYGSDGSARETCGLLTGQTSVGGDCDDSRADSVPGAAEQCDGLDNDCDLQVDEGMPLKTFWSDYDGDGIGNLDYPTQACQLPPGYAVEHGDCNDALAEVNPFAIEICDGMDNDCDNRTDDTDPSLDVFTQSTFWFDRDEDGFGDPLNTTLACTVPVNYVDNADDCDDYDAEILPGGGEVCDGEDNDCDGLWDESDPDLDPAELETFYIDVDSDGYGDGVATLEACFEPLFFVDNMRDCDDDEPLLGLADAWLLDTDGDGVGAGAPSADSCVAPAAGWVLAAKGVDCAAADPGRYPGAAEICGDGVDQDCDVLDLFCSVDIADTCAEADFQPVADSGTWPVDLALGSAANNIDLAANGCTRAATRGGDGFVKLDVGPGELVTLSHTNAQDGSVYLVSDCADATTCVAGAENEVGSGTTESLLWLNDSAVDATMYAVFDCTGAACGDADGLVQVGYDDFLADTCVEAQGWAEFTTGSITISADLTGFANDIDVAKNGCTTQKSDGAEGFLPVFLAPGETLSVEYQQDTADASVYVLGDCTNVASCVRGADATVNTGIETLSHTNVTGAGVTLYVAFDCFAAACNDFTANIVVF